MKFAMQLIWFRQDLRIHDHLALYHASSLGQCIALVILSPEQWQLHNDAPIKIDFYLRELHQLKTELNSLNIPLICLTIPLWQDVPQQILQLCQQHQISTLHSNIELGYNEQQRDVATQTLLAKHHIDFIQYQDRTLFPLQSIRNKSNQPYQVFGAFKKQCYERLSISLPQCTPAIDAQLAQLQHEDFLNPIPSFHSLFAQIDLPKNCNEMWPIGEQHAWDVLDDFIEHNVAFYHQQRDYPNLNATSKLGAYLNIGVISVRQCIQALFRHAQGEMHFENDGQQIWLDELLWREFYQHILFDFPRVSKHLPFKLATKNLIWRNSDEDLKAWQLGQTGIPIIDAGMRQLLATGWMHNRVRMICAVFLTKNLLLDWRLGEAWFMQHLIDGDLAANNGGWQWCASTGTDSAPYFRIFNPVSQSQKFDSDGEYIKTWLPELSCLDAKQIHYPYAKDPNIKLNYPHAIVDLKSSRVRAIEAFKNLGSIAL